MALLPAKDASSLASIMKGKMGPSEPDESAPSYDDAPEGQSELDSCISDVADAVASGDKAGIVSALHALVETLKSEDVEQDSGE